MTTWYRPGPSIALVGPGSLMLLVADSADPLVGRLWPVVRRGAPVTEVLGVLTTGGLFALPDFGLVRWSPDSPVVTVVVRGAVVGALHGTEPAEVSAPHVTTWAEARYERPDAVSLTLASQSPGAGLPLLGGVVVAAHVHHNFTAAAEDWPDSGERAEVAGDGGEVAASTSAPRAGTGNAVPGHSAEPAGVERADTTGAEEGLATKPVAAVEVTLAPPVDTFDGLIDGVPPGMRAGAVPAPRLGDHIGDTVRGDVVESLRRGLQSQPVRVGVPDVLAAYCPAEHPNPPHATTCRICAQPVAAQDPHSIPRPVLGVLRFDSGSVIALERGLMIGRNPRVDGEAGAEVPRLVQVESPEHVVSSNHLRVELLGWDVVVTDLGSRNGSEITVPGQQPIRLHPDQPVMIPPGTRVDLAGEVLFGYEVSR